MFREALDQAELDGVRATLLPLELTSRRWRSISNARRGPCRAAATPRPPLRRGASHRAGALLTAVESGSRRRRRTVAERCAARYGSATGTTWVAATHPFGQRVDHIRVERGLIQDGGVDLHRDAGVERLPRRWMRASTSWPYRVRVCSVSWQTTVSLETSSIDAIFIPPKPRSFRRCRVRFFPRPMSVETRPRSRQLRN